MIRRVFSAFIFCFFSLHSICAADQIILKEGKTLTGTITEENKKVVTINLGANMFLKVDKSKIEEIVREAKPKSTRPVVTMQDLKSKVEKSTPTASSEILNFKVSSETKKIEADNVVIWETNLVKPVFILDPEEADPKQYSVILDCQWKGSSDQKSAQFEWKSVNITALITASVPRWEPPKTADPQQIKDWNQKLQGIDNRNKKRIDIYLEGLNSLGSGLASLHGLTELELRQKSNGFYTSWLSRMEKRQQGLERRQSAAKIKSLKKR